MTGVERNTFVHNIFKFLVGVVLLIASFFYLIDHPAEKVALYSGLQNIVQKIEVFSYNMIGRNGDLLAQKYSLESSYLDMIHFAEERGCIDESILSDLRQTYQTLLKEDKSQIINYITKYNILASDYQSIVYGDCD